MAYTPFGDWVNNAPPGLTAERMDTIENGIKSASEDAEEALDLINQGAAGITSVDGDVKRIYNSGTTPEDGELPGDVVLTLAEHPGTPADLPGLIYWLDASVTGARNLGTALPDVSGNGNDIEWRDLSGQTPAGISVLNGLPAFQFATSRYWWSRTFDGPSTFSGVARFDGTQAGDMPLFYTGSTDAIYLGVRSNGDLYCTVGATTVWEGALAWSSEGRAHLSFVLSVAANATLWISGVQMASVPVTGGGTHGTLALSSGSGEFFTGVLGEFAEHNTTVDSTQAADLAEYYKEKWRV